MKLSKKERMIKEKHLYSITSSKDGKYRTYIKDKTRSNGRRQIVRKNKKDLLDFLYHYYDCKETTIESLFDEWIEYKSLKVEPETITRIKYDYKRYYKDTEIVKVPILELTTLDLDKWIHKLIKDNYPTKHQYMNLTLIIRQILEYAFEKGVINSNPWLRVKVDTRRLLKPERKKKDDTQVFTESEENEFFKLAWNDYNNKKFKKNQLIPLSCIFQFFTGVRIGELCALRYSDIKGNKIIVQRMVKVSGKVIERTKGGYGDREIPLFSKSIEVINACKKRQREEGITTDYIFSMDKKPLNHTSARKAWYKYSKRLNLNTEKSSHKARKTFISKLIDSGINLNRVRQIAGHIDERTTLNNYCFDRSPDTKVIEQLEEAFKLSEC